MKPFKAIPVLKERIWGGQRLKQFNKVFEGQNIGESWETDKDSMPALIKLIDANDILSIQVHPDDVLAWELERQSSGKTEAWVVLECDEGAELIAGIKAGVDKNALEAAIEDNTVLELLNVIKVKKGDCIYIPAGTIHSLGKGIVVYEVQQPSDLTYRLYDWNRADGFGAPRELHIQKALASINYSGSEVMVSNLYQQGLAEQQRRSIFKCDYFKTSYIRLVQSRQYIIQYTDFAVLTAISGSAWIHFEEGQELMQIGDTWIIPEAYRSEVLIVAVEGFEALITENSNYNKTLTCI